MTVTAAKPVQMAMRLRIPAWLQSAPTVKLNGRALDASAAPGSYLTLSRTWKTGDRIEMELPMRLTVEAMPDDPGMQAFLYGPLVLAGDLGADGLKNAASSDRTRLRCAPEPSLPIEVPTFKAAGADPTSWIKPAAAPLTFRTTGQSKDVTLVPLNSLFNRRYSVYWQVT